MGNSILGGFVHFGKSFAIFVFDEDGIVAKTLAASFVIEDRPFAKASDDLLESLRSRKRNPTFKISLSESIIQMAHFCEKLLTVFRISGVEPCITGRINSRRS